MKTELVTFEDKIPKMLMKPFNASETAEKEVRDTSRRGVGGCPSYKKSPKNRGLGG
jgi:hypothetical protein